MKKSLLVIWLILAIGLLVSCSSQRVETVTPLPTSGLPTSMPTIIQPTSTQIVMTTLSSSEIINRFSSLLPDTYLACYVTPSSPNISSVQVTKINDFLVFEKVLDLPMELVGPISLDNRLITIGMDELVIRDLMSNTFEKFKNPFAGPWFHTTISPDGSKLAVGTEGKLFILIIDNGDWRELDLFKDSLDENYRSVVWSPDGQSIAFIVETADQSMQKITKLYALPTMCLENSDGCTSSLKELADLTLAAQAQWITSLSWKTDTQLSVANYEVVKGASIDTYELNTGEKQQPLELPNKEEIDDLNWSPDGEWMAISQAGIQGITILSADGQKKYFIDSCRGYGRWLIIP